MKFAYNTDAPLLIQKIQERTEPLGSYFTRKIYPSNMSAILCSVNHSKIRLMKVSPHKTRMSQRVFRGRVYIKDGKTVIAGHFTFEAIDIILLLLCAFCVIPISIFNRNPHVLKWEDLEISTFLFFLYYIATFIVSIMYYHKEEKTIKEFLESL